MSDTSASTPLPAETHPHAAIVQSQMRNKLVAAALFAVLVPFVLLEAVHRFDAATTDPWLVIIRIGLTLAVSLTAALALAIYISRGWFRQVAAIKAAVESLACGDTQARAEVLCRDELGEIATALNVLAESLPSARGASPAERPTATVVDSLDRSLGDTAEQLAQIVDNVQSAAAQAGESASQIQTSTTKLSKDSEFHAAQITNTSAAVDEIVESIRDVAENTAASAQVAEEARQTATTGSRAVANTIEGMERIRHQVQSTSKRIKQLGESSQQIGEIVQLISDVADRTSLLALNASIQAAMAGDAGQGFGVVAEEVESLSKRCNDSTKQISKLVKGIQSETSKAIAGMEESIAEVVAGSKLASQAGEALGDIDAVSDRLAELIHSISAAAKQQVRGGLLASRSINEISAVMHDNAAGTKQTADSVSELADLIEELHACAVGRPVPQKRSLAGSDAPTLAAASRQAGHAQQTPVSVPVDNSVYPAGAVTSPSVTS